MNHTTRMHAPHHPVQAGHPSQLTMHPLQPVRCAVQTAAMVENFSILSGVIDGIVLARGWLGLHTPPEHMAPLQKRLLRHCNINGKLALVTRIIDSMQVWCMWHWLAVERAPRESVCMSPSMLRFCLFTVL